MNNKFTKRISSDNYKKKGKSYQDSLTNKEIKEKLEEYKEVKNISNVGLNTHLRYITINKKTGKKLFRLGGFLTKVNLTDGYFILSNGKISWSVQINHTLFFEKMSFKELKKEIYNQAEHKYKKKYHKLKEENKKLKKAIKEIKKNC